VADVLRAEDKQRQAQSIGPRFRKGLNIEDIDGTRPRAVRFRTNRCTNPLNPEYPLPSFRQISPSGVAQFGKVTQ
jgi:hypothetical protein